MLQELITSKTRVHVLFMFFLNQENVSYLREIAHALDESTNSLSQELAKLEDLKLLVSFKQGNKKYYQANVHHSFFHDIRNMLLKEIGFDLIKSILYRDVFGLSEIFVIGSHARGINSDIIDLVLVGQQLDNPQISASINEAERITNKKIRFLILKDNVFNKFFGHSKMFKI